MRRILISILGIAILAVPTFHVVRMLLSEEGQQEGAEQTPEAILVGTSVAEEEDFEEWVEAIRQEERQRIADFCLRRAQSWSNLASHPQTSAQMAAKYGKMAMEAEGISALVARNCLDDA